MDLFDLNEHKLALLIVFVVPGFISIKFYQLIFPGTLRSSSEQLIDAIAYSCLNWALLIVPIGWVEAGKVKFQSNICYDIFYFFVLFLAPIIWVLVWKLIRASNMFQRVAPHPTERPWDYVFSKRESFWIKATLKNGKIIGGRYSANSFASSAPADGEIYLEETWLLNDDGGFDRPKERSKGVLLLPGEISFVELIEYEEQDDD